MPIQSPAKDLQKTSTGALFGQGREMGSAQPSERPSQGLCSDRGAKRSQNSPPKDLEKPFKGRCAVADPVSRYSGASGQKTRGAPVMRMLPLFGKRTPARDRKGARGSVRAMPEHSTCRDDVVIVDGHATRMRIHHYLIFFNSFSSENECLACDDACHGHRQHVTCRTPSGVMACVFEKNRSYSVRGCLSGNPDPDWQWLSRPSV